MGDLLSQVDLVHHNGRPDIFKIGKKYSDEELKELLTDNQRPILVAVDDNRAIYNLYATMYVPRTYLIDSEGIIVHATIEYDASYVAQILSAIPQ